jgi:DNA-directed RNA polymerase specialized sigma24 family protein
VAAVARALLANAHDAEDLAQDTLVEALARPPRRLHNLRGWLRTVARNLARKRRRSDERRAHRERQAADGPARRAAEAAGKRAARARSSATRTRARSSSARRASCAGACGSRAARRPRESP